MNETHALSSDHLIPNRAFTHPEHSFYDHRTLKYMIARLCSLFIDGRVTPDSPEMTLFKDLEPDGRALRQIAVRPEKLNRAKDLAVVGFFGNRRIEVENETLTIGDDMLVNSLATQPGLLSYSTIELTCGNFANCVLFTDMDAIVRWSRDPVHAKYARELSPSYYMTVRIYNGRLPGGIHASETLTLDKVKYYDYQESPTWRAQRPLTDVSA